MQISSRTTYLLPFILLFVSTLYITYSWIDCFWGGKDAEPFVVIVSSLAFTGLLFFIFKKISKLPHPNYKYLIVFIPIVIQVASYYIFVPLFKRYFDYSAFLSITSGCVMLLSFNLFLHRYSGILTDESINIKNLFGQTGVIPLKSITLIEEKRNILSVIRLFRILELSQKMQIGYTDENMEEYQILLFIKVFSFKDVYQQIIDKANKCGNLKIRQYTF